MARRENCLDQSKPTPITYHQPAPPQNHRPPTIDRFCSFLPSSSLQPPSTTTKHQPFCLSISCLLPTFITITTTTTAAHSASLLLTWPLQLCHAPLLRQPPLPPGQPPPPCQPPPPLPPPTAADWLRKHRVLMRFEVVKDSKRIFAKICAHVLSYR